MTDKKSWDDIPSLNVEMDDSAAGEETEERRHPRTDQNALKSLLHDHMEAPVKVLTYDKGEFEGMILDVSKNGVKMASPKSLKKGERVRVSFTLSNRQIVAKAVACWVSSESNGFHIGLELQNLPDVIAEFIDSLNTANLLRGVGKLKEGSSKNRS